MGEGKGRHLPLKVGEEREVMKRMKTMLALLAVMSIMIPQYAAGVNASLLT
jgi:hypothetical protein